MLAGHGSTERSTARAIALVALSAGCFGAISILTLVVTRAGTPLLPAMLWRYTIALLVMGSAVAVARPRAPTLRQAATLIAIGGAGQAGITYMSLLALDYIPVGPLAFLFYTYPAWVTLMSTTRGVDRLNGRRAVALVLALGGVAIIVGSPWQSTLHPTGVALALGAAVSYGVYLPLVSAAQRGVEPLVAATLVVCGAALAFGAATAASGAVIAPVPPRAAVAILALALVSTVGAFWLLLAGLAVLGPVRTAIVATLEPFVTTMLAVGFLGNRVGMRTAVGGAFIATAVVLIQRAAASGHHAAILPPPDSRGRRE